MGHRNAALLSVYSVADDVHLGLLFGCSGASEARLLLLRNVKLCVREKKICEEMNPCPAAKDYSERLRQIFGFVGEGPVMHFTRPPLPPPALSLGQVTTTSNGGHNNARGYGGGVEEGRERRRDNVASGKADFLPK